MKRTIRVGIVQQACTNDLKLNLEKLHRNIASVAQAGAQLVVLQELHNTPYFCQTEDTNLFDLAEPIPCTYNDLYREIAAAFHIMLFNSLLTRRAAELKHTTAVKLHTEPSLSSQYLTHQLHNVPVTSTTIP